MSDRVATLYGSEFDSEEARTRPEVFVSFFGLYHPADRAAAIAALEGHHYDRWPELIRPFAVPLPSIPVTAPGVLLSATPMGAVARPPPQAMRLAVNSPDWHFRCKILCEILAQQIDRLEGRPAADVAAHFNALSLQWTAAVEMLELEPCQSLQHAICLYCTTHEPWNEAALSWLETVAFTWWPRWRAAHPEVLPLLTLKQGWGFPSPKWLLGSADA